MAVKLAPRGRRAAAQVLLEPASTVYTRRPWSQYGTRVFERAVLSWPAAIMILLALVVSSNYNFFTTQHITIVGSLVTLSAFLDHTVLRAWLYVQCVYLTLFVGAFFTGYMAVEPCLFRYYMAEFDHNLPLVWVGNLYVHMLFPFLLLATVPPDVPLQPTVSSAMLPALYFTCYSAYLRPCLMYPIADRWTSMLYVLLWGSLVYGVLIGVWLVVHRLVSRDLR